MSYEWLKFNVFCVKWLFRTCAKGLSLAEETPLELHQHVIIAGGKMTHYCVSHTDPPSTGAFWLYLEFIYWPLVSSPTEVFLVGKWGDGAPPPVPCCKTPTSP